MTTPIEIRERALLEVIQKRLPKEQRERLNYLRQRNEDEEITEAEHQELLMYVERVKQQDAGLGALIQLAQLCSCDLKIVINEFLSKHCNII